MLSNLVKKDGFNFAFDPNGCNSCAGNCCIGESGYIWINSVEIQALALHLKISAEDLKKRYLNKRATKSISCSSFSIPVLLIIRSSIISLNFQFSIFNYLSMFTNRPAIDTRIESELTQRVVLLPISEFLAFVLFGVT